MKSEYSFEKKENYLLMRIAGEYAMEDFMSFAAILLERCEKDNVNKVLVDAFKVRNTNVDIMDRFYIGENIAKLLGSKLRLAVIWPEEHINKFAEDVAVNRGGRLFVTHSIELAEEWLLGDMR
jgi:hypothetical protein